MFNASVIRGTAAQGYSSCQAMDIIRQMAEEHLPDNIGVERSVVSGEESRRPDRNGALVFLFVFLFLLLLGLLAKVTFRVGRECWFAVLILCILRAATSFSLIVAYQCIASGWLPQYTSCIR